MSSSLTAASSVGPGVAWEPLGGLEVAAVVAPAGGVAPLAPRVVAPLARTMYQAILVTEGLAVVTLASVLAVGAGVVEALVLVVEALVLEVAVEAIVVEGLGVVTAVATVGSSTKESTKEPASQMLNFCFD